MAQNFRKKLYPNYKKRKKKIHPDDKPPEERYKNIRDAEQAVQDADMEEGNYLQDPEQPNFMQIIEEVWQDTKEFKPWYQPGENIGALGARAIESMIPTNFQELQQELVELKSAGKLYPAKKLVGEIPFIKQGLETVSRKMDDWLSNPVFDRARRLATPEGNTLPNVFEARTTPESTGRKILQNKPISKGRQPGDYTLSELESAYRGSGREKNIKYSKAVRYQTTKIDLNLGKKLQEKYGGTDDQVKEFIRNQIEAQKSVRQTLSTLNSKQRDYQISQLASKNLSKPELRKAIEKISKTTYYDLGHIRSAKNVFRYEELMGADRASNIFPEISQNVVDYSKTTGKPLRVVEKGNLSRGARSDIPDDILTMTGTSRTIDEEYLKFIDPELGNMVSELIDPKMQDRLFNIVQERWKRFSSAGYPDFAEFLDEVHGMKYYKYNKLPQTKKNALRIEFNKQKEPVIGKQQQMLFKPFVRKVVDEYIESVQAGRELSEYTKKGLANTNVTDLLKMLRITNE